MHHGDDLVEHRTREASLEAQCTNHSMINFKTRHYRLTVPLLSYDHLVKLVAYLSSYHEKAINALYELYHIKMGESR